jgi:hypothetical protein
MRVQIHGEGPEPEDVDDDEPVNTYSLQVVSLKDFPLRLIPFYKNPSKGGQTPKKKRKKREINPLEVEEDDDEEEEDEKGGKENGDAVETKEKDEEKGEGKGEEEENWSEHSFDSAEDEVEHRIERNTGVFMELEFNGTIVGRSLPYRSEDTLLPLQHLKLEDNRTSCVEFTSFKWQPLEECTMTVGVYTQDGRMLEDPDPEKANNATKCLTRIPVESHMIERILNPQLASVLEHMSSMAESSTSTDYTPSMSSVLAPKIVPSTSLSFLVDNKIEVETLPSGEMVQRDGQESKRQLEVQIELRSAIPSGSLVSVSRPGSPETVVAGWTSRPGTGVRPGTGLSVRPGTNSSVPGINMATNPSMFQGALLDGFAFAGKFKSRPKIQGPISLYCCIRQL